MINPRIKRTTGSLFLLALLKCSGVSADASISATDYVTGDIASLIEQRQERFEVMGDAFKLFRAYVKDPDTVALERLERASAALRENASDIASYFPEGSGPESGFETDALAYIWRNDEKFQKLADALPVGAENLVTAVNGGQPETIVGAVRDVADTCRSCHRSFRAD